MIDDKQLDEWLARCDAATPGPWCVCEGDLCRNECPGAKPESCPYQCEECLITSHEDKMFIVTAREAMPKLIEEVRHKDALWHLTSEELRCTMENLEKICKEGGFTYMEWLEGHHKSSGDAMSITK